jgi:hypothetical protein
VNDPDPEKIIPNLRNKNVDANAQRSDMIALALNQATRSRLARINSLKAASSRWKPLIGCSSKRWISSTPGKSRRASAMSTARRPSVPVVCWHGGWWKPACDSSTSITRADRSGMITGM